MERKKHSPNVEQKAVFVVAAVVVVVAAAVGVVVVGFHCHSLFIFSGNKCIQPFSRPCESIMQISQP